METKGDDFVTAKGHFSEDINSITTSNDQRDGHVKRADFFDEANYPKLTFETQNVEKVDDEKYKVHGIFTMRGVSKKIILDAELGGVNQDQGGNTKIGFSLNGKINRKDFGVNFGLLTETANIAVSNEVRLLVNVQFVKQQEA
jgi:polyisoprenoid-binding protein YceI